MSCGEAGYEVDTVVGREDFLLGVIAYSLSLLESHATDHATKP